MKRITLLFTAVGLFILSSSAQQSGSMDSASMMKAWQSFMSPGDIHKMLAKDDGEWAEEYTMWMAPGAAPQKSTSTVVNKMILGGRYQQSTHKGSFMGMPFEGESILGYDNAKKMFVSSWIDNMGTGIVNMEGSWDDATKTVNLKGKQTDPMTGKETDVRQTIKMIDNNNQQVEMFTSMNGSEFKTMEIRLKRK